MEDTVLKEFLQQIEAEKRKLNKTMKSLFAGQIRQNFMLEVAYAMLLKYPDVSSFATLPGDMQAIVSGRTSNTLYLLCEHIVGVHRSKTIFMTNQERSKMENDVDYRSELMEDVYKELKLRELTGLFIREGKLLRGDRFILFPLPYYVLILTIKLLELAPQTKEMPGVYVNIANKSLAILSLLQDNFSDCAYSSCRVIIEDYVRGTIFHNCKEAGPEFERFAAYELKQMVGHKFPEEFLTKFNNRINKTEKNIIEYLHYGWADSIPKYHEIVRDHPYTFGGIKRMIVKKFEPSEVKTYELLNKYHTLCNGYTHGSATHSIYPLIHYFEITTILLYVTVNVYSAVCKELEQDTKINGVDVIGEIRKHHSIFNVAFGKGSTENYEQYYKNNKF